MRVPNALARRARLGLKILLAQVLIRRVALQFLELCPSVLEELRREIRAVELSSTNVARDVVVRRQRVRGCEGDRLADGQRAEELA